ncbi:hypothetical protein B0H11DRAFT_2207367 [Mycena galericulata]|nr:hypothetical protein B0H11DRAFT_2207367 [Mycena galericulata]
MLIAVFTSWPDHSVKLLDLSRLPNQCVTAFIPRRLIFTTFFTWQVKGRPLSVFYPDGPFPAPTPSAHRKSISSHHGRGVGVRELCNHLLTPCSRYVMHYASPCLQSTYPTLHFRLSTCLPPF